MPRRTLIILGGIVALVVISILLRSHKSHQPQAIVLPKSSVSRPMPAGQPTVSVTTTAHATTRKAEHRTTTTTTSTTTTRTRTETTRSAITTQSISRPLGPTSGLSSLSNPSTKKLLDEAEAFLSAYYYIKPDDTNKTHIAYLVGLAAKKQFFMDVHFVQALNFSLDEKSGMPAGQLNKQRQQLKLTIKGTPSVFGQEIQPLNKQGTVVLINAPVLVKAYYPNKSQDQWLLQQPNTVSTWQYGGGKWTVVSIKNAGINGGEL